MNTRIAPSRTALALAAALCLAGCCRPSLAQELSLSPEVSARRLADEALRRAGDDEIGAWTRDAIDRALERAGMAARRTVPGAGLPGGYAGPLPAERHAGELSRRRSGTAEVLIFTSLSVPAVSWRQWARYAARTGAPLVLRGVADGSLRATAGRIGDRLGGAEAGPGSKSGAGIAIDPRLFRLFAVDRVPAVVVVPGGVPPCRSRGCADDPAPPHDRVTGNIGLVAALEAVATEGDAGRAVAIRNLERLTGDKR